MRKLLTTGAAVAAALTLALGVGAATSAAAPFGISSFDVGYSSPLAGAHGDVSVQFELNLLDSGPGQGDVDGNLRNVAVELPPGVLGDPHATPTCGHEQLVAAACDPATAVGSANVKLGDSFDPLFASSLFNIAPRPGEPARLGFLFIGLPIEIGIQARSAGDFGLTSSSTVAPMAGFDPAYGMNHGVRLDLWGVPHDPAHSAVTGYTPPPDEVLRPFMANPTRCGAGELTSRLRVSSWEDPDVVHTATSTAPRPTDCEGVPFTPSLNVTPATTTPDSPTALQVDVGLDQPADADGRASSHLRSAVVRLPAGISLSPSAASRLEACSDAQFAKGSNDAPTCPAASQIGTAEVVSPVLSGPLEGAIHVGSQQPGDPYRIFVVASGDGVVLKLVGHVRADAATGQLTTVFDDLPETPFSRFTLRFKGGSTAPLATPATCGTRTATSTMTPWSGGAAGAPASSFEIAGCPGALPWTPTLQAGMSTTTAGGPGAFTMTVGRADGQATLRRIALSLPPGVTGHIARVPLCNAGLGAAGTCPEQSRIGSASVLAGPGSSPVALGGRVYLTEGYDGAPFGLSIVVPAKAGPYDLGTVVVRAKIAVDPRTSALTVTSDPLPTILEGIPLRMRRVTVAIDRDGFMRAPTSCAAKTIAGTLGSVESGDASPAVRLQVGDCAKLPFGPRLAIKLFGRGETRAARHPGLDAVLTQKPGESAARSVGVTLPLSLATDQQALRTACTEEQVAQGSCARAGTVSAVTPLLRDPLRGPVYFVKRPRGLPKLVLMLRGQVSFVVEGDVVLVGKQKRLRTTFAVPDVPLSRFRLRLHSGKNGLLTPVRDVCSVSRRAQLNMVSHSSRRIDRTLTLGVRCPRRGAPRSAQR